MLAAGLLVATTWSVHALDLGGEDLLPGPGSWALAGDFLSRALSPALRSEAAFVPHGAPPLWIGALRAAGTTVVYALAATGIAIALGLVLGFFASSAWWTAEGTSADSKTGRIVLAASLHALARGLIAVLRSIHELLWAVLFLAAVGLSEVAAIFAIAIPCSGILAKVYSELVDEIPRDGAEALRLAGASRLQIYCFGLVPRALPDMAAYSFYRLECAVRSSAVLGFFGFPTLGLYIRQSFDSTNHGEVWTYLYVLIALVAAFDAWSGALRRRLT